MTLSIVGLTLSLMAVAIPAGLPAQTQQDASDSKPTGQVPYERVCMVCHGPEGRGDGAPTLVPFDRTYYDLLAIIRDGRGEMPPISTRRLSDDETKQIVEYLGGLKP